MVGGIPKKDRNPGAPERSAPWVGHGGRPESGDRGMASIGSVVGGMTLALLSCLGVAIPAAGAVDDDPRSPEEELRHWIERLEREEPGVRRTAVKRLAELGERRAWEAVFGALTDPEPEVSDEAQIQLGRLEDPKLIDSLLGRQGLRSRDRRLALRVAESLGRMPGPLEGMDLLDGIRSSEVEPTRTLILSVERRALAGTLGGDSARTGRELGKIARTTRHGECAAAAWVARFAVDPDSTVEELGKGLASREPLVRAACIEIAGRLDQPEARRWVEGGLTDPSRDVRLAALEALGEAGDRGAAVALARRLAEEPGLRSRWAIVEALRRMSGLAHRLDPRPWRDWAEGLAAGPLPPPRVRRGGGAGGAARGGSGSASFGGLPVRSERVSFLIDLSGSIWSRQADGKTRKEVIDGLLRKALEALPETSAFNVVPYASEPKPWREQLTLAKPRAVAEALEDFEGRQDRGRGNLFDAIEWALRDPEVDTLIILSDGVPTGGYRWNLELMVELLESRLRFRRVALDFVLVRPKKRVRERWEGLAEATGGQLIAIDL